MKYLYKSTAEKRPHKGPVHTQFFGQISLRPSVYIHVYGRGPFFKSWQMLSRAKICKIFVPVLEWTDENRYFLRMLESQHF